MNEQQKKGCTFQHIPFKTSIVPIHLLSFLLNSPTPARPTLHTEEGMLKVQEQPLYRSSCRSEYRHPRRHPDIVPKSCLARRRTEDEAVNQVPVTAEVSAPQSPLLLLSHFVIEAPIRDTGPRASRFKYRSRFIRFEKHDIGNR